MKTKLIPAIALGATLVAGCSSSPYDKGPYLPQQSKTPAYENTERLVFLDPAVQYSITSSGMYENTLPDGRLEIIVQFRNRENRRIEVQTDCVFKDAAGVIVGDQAPFQTLILTENATEQVRFISANNLAKKYTIRVRQAR